MFSPNRLTGAYLRKSWGCGCPWEALCHRLVFSKDTRSIHQVSSEVYRRSSHPVSILGYCLASSNRSGARPYDLSAQRLVSVTNLVVVTVTHPQLGLLVAMIIGRYKGFGGAPGVDIASFISNCNMSFPDRKKYAGDTRRLLLAFDIGTTFSGISYRLAFANYID